MALDRLTPEDARILQLEAGNVRGHTCKVVVLGGGAALDALRERIGSRLHRMPRFRRRLAPTPLRLAEPVWVDDHGFDPARHVRPAAGGRAVSDDEFRELVAGLMAQRLPRDRPLWQMDVVERLERGGSALVWRVHHAMADGSTVMTAARELLFDDAVDREEQPRPLDPVPSAGRLLAAGAAARLGRLGRGGAMFGHELVRPQAWQRMGHEATALPQVLARELRRAADLSELDRRAGPERRVAFASVPLAECRQIGKRIDGATVNDVVLAAVAGAIRRRLERIHSEGAHLRVQVPVSLHHAGDDAANADSYFFVDLPVAEDDPVERLRAINRETAERKRHHDAEALYHLPFHGVVARWALSPRVFTFNVSNVPGPREPVSILGAPLREMYSLAEIAEHHALRVAVVSVAGILYFGLCADREAVPDLDLVARDLEEAVAELAARAG